MEILNAIKKCTGFVNPLVSTDGRTGGNITIYPPDKFEVQNVDVYTFEINGEERLHRHISYDLVEKGEFGLVGGNVMGQNFHEITTPTISFTREASGQLVADTQRILESLQFENA